MSRAPLEVVADAVRDEGGLLADTVPDGAALDAGSAAHGARVARGPRSAGDPDAYAFVVEAIREGYLLHYDRAAARVIRTEDRDLALLAGDRMYALGLERLAALGDLAAVDELADVIALCAAAHADGSPELAEAVWEAGVAAVGWGPSEALAAAKDRARTNAPSAADALRTAARQLTDDVAR